MNPQGGTSLKGNARGGKTWGVGTPIVKHPAEEEEVRSERSATEANRGRKARLRIKIEDNNKQYRKCACSSSSKEGRAFGEPGSRLVNLRGRRGNTNGCKHAILTKTVFGPQFIASGLRQTSPTAPQSDWGRSMGRDQMRL